MKKQVYFDKLLKSTFNSEVSGISLSAGTFEKIQDRLTNECDNKRNLKRHSLLFKKPAAIAACLVLALVFTLLLSPQARAYAYGLAETLGIRLFKLTEEEMKKLKMNSIDVDVDRMQGGQIETINGISIQKSEPKDDAAPGAILSEKVGEGVIIEKSLDSFQVTDPLIESIKENSSTVDFDGVAQGADPTSDEIKLEKSN